jgi:hypothetical protein
LPNWACINKTFRFDGERSWWERERVGAGERERKREEECVTDFRFDKEMGEMHSRVIERECCGREENIM